MDINKIVDQHKKNDCPDIVLLARSLGFSVKLVNSNKSFRSIMKNKEIFIRQDMIVSGRKFLVAYHLAEFILRGKKTSIIYMDELYDKQLYEYAVDLIIPSNKINKKTKNINIKTESRKYDVSPSIVLYKIERRGRR